MLLIQPKMRLIIFAERAHSWPVFALSSRTPRSFSLKLLLSQVASSLYWCRVICLTVCSQGCIDTQYTCISTNTRYCHFQSAQIFNEFILWYPQLRWQKCVLKTALSLEDDICSCCNAAVLSVLFHAARAQIAPRSYFSRKAMTSIFPSVLY